MHKWLCALLAVCVLIAYPHLADATPVAASFAISGPNTYTGPCPVTIQFTGSIVGAKGVSVTYKFDRFVNGGWIYGSPVSTTIPLNGPLPLGENLLVDGAHAGPQSNQVTVTSPNSTQAKVSFTVNCVAATPAPTPQPTPTKAPPPPPSPSSLGSTNDPQVCTNHAGFGGGLACKAGFSSGMLALIWTAPNSCSSCISGYKVYRVDSGQHTFITKQANGKDVTLALLTKPSGGFSGKCYAVTSYAGNAESSDSATYCVNGAVDTPVVRSFNVTPNAQRQVMHHYSYSFPGPGCGIPTEGLGTVGLPVGFIHDYSSSVGVTCYEDTYVWQSAIGFDLGTAGIILRSSKASVKNATLTYQRADGGSGPTCLAAVGLPTGDWSNAQDLIPNNVYISGLPWNNNGGPGQNAINVTSAVNNFAKGVWDNHGFLFMGGDEDTSGVHNNDECVTGYANFALNIQVIIQP